MKEFSTYLFDFDGTLVDSHDSLVEVFSGAYSKVGVKVPDGYVLRLMRIPLFKGYEELHGPEDEESKKIFGDEIIRLLDDDDILRLTKTYDEVREVLFELKRRGKKLGIVTSNSQKHVRAALKFINLDENLFSVIIGNKETKLHKPHPDPILKGLEVLGVSKEEACYVGDGLDDMRSAINANITPILVDRMNEYSSECEIIIPNIKPLIE